MSAATRPLVTGKARRTSTLRTQLLAREQSANVERTRTLQVELRTIGKRLPELDKLDSVRL